MAQAGDDADHLLTLSGRPSRRRNREPAPRPADDHGPTPNTPEAAPAGVGGTPSDPRRWWALAVLAAAQLMIVLDASIVNIALPSAQRDLGITNADRQWVVTAYTLAFGGLLLLGGRIADYTGRKRTFIIGLLGFAAASALGGIASTQGLLFAARGAAGRVRRADGPGVAVAS